MIKIMMIQPPCISDLFSIFPDNVNNQFDKKNYMIFPTERDLVQMYQKVLLHSHMIIYLPPGY